jgi:hypothetical protein
VNEVNASQLAAILADTRDASHSEVVMTAGVMPRMVFSRSSDIITPWVRAGGILVWSGDAIGYLSEGPRRSFAVEPSSSYLAAGPLRIVGANVFTSGKVYGRDASTPTPSAAALGLSLAETTVSVNLAGVTQHGGQALGFIGSGLSSISDIPVGLGRVDLLAGDTNDEQTIAHDLTLIILTRVSDATGPIAWTSISAGTRNFAWAVPSSLAAGQTLLVTALDPGPEGVAFQQQPVTLR